MQSAIFSYALLSGARLTNADLRQADLSGAQLQGADLTGARLQGANLRGVQLQGAYLNRVQLQGADLSFAQFQGAHLDNAKLQVASLNNANLQVAGLSFAQLQGADLSFAQFQGAQLVVAQLQGADLSNADLSDSELDGTFVFRTVITDANLATAAIRSIEGDKVKPAGQPGKTEPLTEADVDGWIAAATKSAGEKDKPEITQRFARLKPVQPTERDASDQAKWAERLKQSLSTDPDGAQFHRRLADRLGDLVCGADGAPYVARGLVRSGRLAALGDQLEGVRKRMKDGRKESDKCPGVVGFTEEDWKRLEAIKPN